ncbi:MAG: hypothetical protein N2200_01175 [Bacteroidia bacterium]|nr:hypothetical protein [Bacteroidia bacterium]
MFWHDEDEVDIEGLRERYESEDRAGKLGYYAQSELKELFDWYMDCEDFQAARTVIEHATYLYPDWAQPLWWRSLLAYAEGRNLEAYVQGMQAFEQMALSAEVYEHLVEVSVAAGRSDVASWLFELWWDEASEDAEKSWGAQLLAEILLLHGIPEAAISFFWTSWRLAPSKQKLTITRNLALAYKTMGKYDAGIHAFHKELWEYPTEPSLWLGLVRLYLYKLSYAQALQALQEAEQLLETHTLNSPILYAELYSLKALWHEAHHQSNEAYRAWLWARHYKPTKPYIMSKLLGYYLSQNDLDGAQLYAEKLCKVGLHIPQVRKQIADYYWQRRQYDQATMHYRTLIKHPKHRINAIGRLFVGALITRDIGTLQKLLRYGAKHFAQQPSAWLHWIEAVFSAGYKVFALRLVEYALRLSDFKPSAPIFYWHAALSVQNRAYDAALISLELALISAPTQVELFLKLTQGIALPTPFYSLLRRYNHGQLSSA